MGLYIPETYGGTALGTLAFCLAVEEIAWACASTAVIYLVQYAGGFPIVLAGRQLPKRRYLTLPPDRASSTAHSLTSTGPLLSPISRTTTSLTPVRPLH